MRIVPKLGQCPVLAHSGLIGPLHRILLSGKADSFSCSRTCPLMTLTGLQLGEEHFGLAQIRSSESLCEGIVEAAEHFACVAPTIMSRIQAR